MRNVMGVFATIADADRVIAQLREVGIKKDQISLLVRRQLIRDYLAEYDRLREYIYGIGSIRGATLKGVLGLTAGIGAIEISPIGALIAVGDLTSTIRNTNNFWSSLASLELSDSQAKQVQHCLLKNHIVIAVRHESWAKIREIMQHCGATLVTQFKPLHSASTMASH